ncbi:MAG: hypothetical protein L3J95_01810 [Thermoplasmata archaeon]|nr:hypothetical protein [Thermoplasmata archaeon]MCI4359149.1 hypothetical protein [Thermoplasmata archaeon]
MATQRRHLRLLPCRECGHLRASHYLLAPQDGRMRRHFSRPRDRATPIPCHVMNCECARFLGDLQVFLCPVCAREYATRASLEIHLYGHHPGLSVRERSLLLHGAMSGRVVLPASVLARMDPSETEGQTADV